MKKFYFAIALLFVVLNGALAQSTSLTPGVDIMSRYIWRGLNLGGSSPSLQPSLEFTYSKLTLGTWGAFATGNNFIVQETDLYVTYTPVDPFSVTLTDYFLADELAGNNHYFDFREDSTVHLLELSASFNGSDKIPFTFLAAINFWGADARNAENKKQYSTYFELGYKRMIKDVECKLFIGGTATNPQDGSKGFYANDAGITNIGVTAVKKIEITDKFSLPFTSSFIINPQTEKVFLVIGLSF